MAAAVQGLLGAKSPINCFGTFSQALPVAPVDSLAESWSWLLMGLIIVVAELFEIKHDMFDWIAKNLNS